VLEGIRAGEAMMHNECPACGKPIRYVIDGLVSGWICSACDWCMWTTNVEALERLPVGRARAVPDAPPHRPRE
jgi:hypothetical protein